MRSALLEGDFNSGLSKCTWMELSCLSIKVCSLLWKKLLHTHVNSDFTCCMLVRNAA